MSKGCPSGDGVCPHVALALVSAAQAAPWPGRCGVERWCLSVCLAAGPPSGEAALLLLLLIVGCWGAHGGRVQGGGRAGGRAGLGAWMVCAWTGARRGGNMARRVDAQVRAVGVRTRKHGAGVFSVKALPHANDQPQPGRGNPAASPTLPRRRFSLLLDPSTPWFEPRAFTHSQKRRHSSAPAGSPQEEAPALPSTGSPARSARLTSG